MVGELSARFPLTLVPLALVVGLLTASCGEPEPAVRGLDLNGANLNAELTPLGRSIGNSRIVLLGENGHGVGELSDAKVEIVRWLHEEHGFGVVAFESGFFECGHVDRRIGSLTARESLLQCLSYPFQHRELLPLFDLIRESKATDRPLVLAGIDIQDQGFDSEPRPAEMYAVLAPVDPTLAERVARLDSALFLVPDAGGLGDSIYAWAAENEATAIADYEAAAVATTGWDRWVFRLATDWVRRLATRGRAERDDPAAGRPMEYYAIRDEGMARAVTAIADSIDGRRKVIVWLHNDHARYGDFASGDGGVPSAGGRLKESYGRDVYSIGLFMGRGLVADNGRNEREIAPRDSLGIEAYLAAPGTASSFVVLRDASAPVANWAAAPRPYLRMGLEAMTLVPVDEFDAMIYVDSVGPPNYDLR